MNEEKKVEFGFEMYLLKVGSLMENYRYTIHELGSNMEYFRKCYEGDLSAYKALEWLGIHIEEKSSYDKRI